MVIAEELAAGLQEMQISATAEQQKQLVNYLQLLKKWNATFNLTAIREVEKMVSSHLLDSLAVMPHLCGKTWVDVGSGGGIPGLIIAIMKPEWSITMIDSNSKKTGFIQQAAIELGLKNVEVVNKRVEEWSPVKKFDGIISRAFADLKLFTEMTAHLLGDAGKWAAMKGLPEQEIMELPSRVVVEKVVLLKVPKLGASRSLVILRKAND